MFFGFGEQNNTGVKSLGIRSFKPRPLPNPSVSFKIVSEKVLCAQSLVRIPTHSEKQRDILALLELKLLP